MNRNILFITLGGILAVIVLFVIFIVPNNRQSNNQPRTSLGIVQNNNTEIETYFGGGETSLIIVSYGGKRDIKTLNENDTEYALLRDPESTGNLELAQVDPYGAYYFAEDENGDRIVYEEGRSQGRHGYDEVGLVSEQLIRERNTFTEYFVAYPDELSAEVAGIIPVANTGVANNFLKTRYVRITNINNNTSVIAEVDHRGSEQGTLMVSEAVRNGLQLDNGATGNLRIDLIPAIPGTTGVSRITI